MHGDLRSKSKHLVSYFIPGIHSGLSDGNSDISHCQIYLLCRFQAAMKKYGVPEEEIFQTPDLFERRNIQQVALSLYSLGRMVSFFLHIVFMRIVKSAALFL